MRKLLKFILAIILFFGFSGLLHSQTVDDIKSKIDEKNNQIKQLELEISQYNLEVNNASTQAKSLLGTIKSLDLSKKKITADISLTEKKIDKTNLTIGQLSRDIELSKKKVALNRQAVMDSFRNTRVLDDQNVVMVVLSQKSINSIWSEIDSISKVSDEMHDKVRGLTVLQQDMQKKQDSMLGQKKSLLSLSTELVGKKKSVEYTVQQKAAILSETKNKEQVFKSLVQIKQEQKAQFEKELYDFESQLNISIDKGGYPVGRNGILSWPLDDVYITQRFGKTVGAEKLYKSGSHNGVDFRASIGTKVKNVLNGTVVGTGNTDLQKGCYSFGKWVMVKHDNGLSTIYGHLSVISAAQGQRLATGDLIGFSGNTGYSTGPHLHISVYATQGVRIEKYVNSNGCKNVVLPLADVKAYLDPLAYFPNY